MSPDARRHRGAHPADAELFGADQVPKLRVAVDELCWLLSRNYKMTSSLKLVGDRYGLRERQRLAVSRCACSDQNGQRRKSHCVGIDQLRNQPLVVDGFNLIITIEAALSKGPMFVGVDNCIRDLSSVHGSYRSVDETERAISMIGQALQRLEPSSVLWLLDRPVSNSGRLAAKISEFAVRSDYPWEVQVVFNPDAAIIASPAVAITSDGSILDRVERWVDLKSYLLAREVPEAWMIDLRTRAMRTIPRDFVKRLNETIAWCAPRVNIGDPKYCLRSAQLRPDYEFSSEPDNDVDIWWADIPMIRTVVDSRAQLLTTAEVVEKSDIDLHGGRLLIYFLGESNHNGLTADITSYFLDNNDTPPWDTWVQAFIPEQWASSSPDAVPSMYPFLISWVPPAFIETVNEATESECVGMLMWANAPRRFDGPPNYADSIPVWLEQLS